MADPTQRAEEQVLKYAQPKVGHKAVGRGECWDLPIEALRHAKALTPHDLGNDLAAIGRPAVDYVWGEEIPLRAARPGDILQFKKVRVKNTWRKKGIQWERTYNFGDRHTAIVSFVGKDNLFTLINQHIGRSGKVVKLDINLSPENVTGTIKAYRPIPKPRK